MRYFPLFVDLQGQPCLVVGAGRVGARKAALLQRAGARVTVVAPSARDSLDAGVHHLAEAFRDEHLAGMRLVIAATADRSVNRQVAEAAERANVLCNVVDDAPLSRFILPAIVDRDPVTVAVSTGGSAPVLARELKVRIEAWLPSRIGELAAWAGSLRRRVALRYPSATDRRRFWQRFFDGPAAAERLAGNEDRARAALRDELRRPAESGGVAWIVGAGPGDPDLLTLKAQRVIGRADVVLHDSLVSAAVLDVARKEAELIDVGKRAGGRGAAQSEINRMLVELVRGGRRVVRLKGGDPFVFGRGGEEVAALDAAGLRYEVVPGVSAALGCAAYAGIPLTLRGVSRRITFATATLAEGDSADWATLAAPGQTLALYMGLGRLPATAAGLVAAGLPGSTPAAVVAAGTTAAQQVLRGTLDTIAARTAAAGLEPPALLFVGEAVGAMPAIPWFAGGRLRPAAVFPGPAATARPTALSA